MGITSNKLETPRIPRFNDCWNQIGIRGDGSCPELQAHVHCRNCPTYSAAAATLLDRAPPAGDEALGRGEYARTEQLPSGGAASILVFRVGAEWLGLATALIQEITEERPIHSLPHQRNTGVLGIVNIRGALVLCMSLARVLDVEPARDDEQIQNRTVFKPMLVTSHGEHVIVFSVDEVDGVHRFPESAMVPVPSTVGHSAALYTQGILPWRDRAVGVLDGDSLFQALNRSLA